MPAGTFRQGARGPGPGAIVQVVAGDLLEPPVQAVGNPWNRNVVPRWLLRPGGVSDQLKQRTGTAPWRVLHSLGRLQLGKRC